MGTKIVPAILQRNIDMPQPLPYGASPVRMVSADDDRNLMIDIWFEVDAKATVGVDVNFLVVKAYTNVPETYEHVGSTLSNTGDSYHIYREVAQKPTTDIREIQLSGLSREMDYEFSLFKAPSRIPFLTGTTSEEGAYELLSSHSNHDPMGKAQLIHQLRQSGGLKIYDQEINDRTYFMVFHKLRPTDGM